MRCVQSNDISRARLGLLLASSSVAALLIAGSTPAAWAACPTSITGAAAGCTNSTTITGINVHAAVVTGSINNTGLISTNGISVNTTSTINGSIVDSGTLVGGINIDATSKIISTPTAINITGSTFTGGISNAGTISASIATAILLTNVVTFSGNISNSGSIAAAIYGININGAGTLTGAISNAGTISTAGSGILAAFIGTFTGGINNSGTITTGHVGMGASGDLTFQGGITNATTGTITAGKGISVTQVSTFSGGISNAGKITASVDGILVDGGNSFAGGISNASTATISAPVGIQVGLKTSAGTVIGVTNFTGNISNAGTITGKSGISIVGSTINGSIVDSGTLVETNHGIVIDSASKIVSTATGIKITGPTLTGGISNAGVVSAASRGILLLNTATLTGGISNSGTVSVHGTGVRVDTVAQFSGGIMSGGTITAGDIGIFAFKVSTFTGGIANAGTISAGTFALLVENVSNFSGGITNTGTVSSLLGNGIAASGVSAFTGNISNAGTITAKTGIRIGAGVGFAAGGAIVNSGNISGSTAAIDVSAATSPVTINQNAGTVAGAIKLSANADALNVAGGAIIGNIVGAGIKDTINFALGSGTFTYAAAFGFSGINQVNINSGTVILNGTNNATNIDVNGGTLGGSGTLDPLTVTIHSGATFAPGTPGTAGTSMTITGNLAFQSGALYLVQINPATASFATVSGTAALAGNVNANFASGSYGSKQYDILRSGGLSGTFASLSTTNLPAGFAATLSYTPTDVLLNLSATLGQVGGNLNVNQQNVANALNGFFNSGGALPAGFLPIFGLTGGNLSNVLTQLDGEAATGAERGAFDMMTQFLSLMLDPFVDGRSGTGWPLSGGIVNGFAPEQQASFPPAIALGYASVLKAPPKPAAFDQRWSTWGAGFGGGNTTNGNAVIGSNTITAHDYGFAGGMDYHFSPDTVAGFALAGGGTNWGLAQGLGGGRSDAFQAGVYGTSRSGPAYIAAALAFANHWMSTSRFALAGDQLTAHFNAQGYGGRIETGYRYAVQPTVGVTPYAALQAQSFHTPSYSETDVTGGGFGLSYNAMSATDTRSELGARFDDMTALGGMPLSLRARLAWAHDWVTNPALAAVFQSLPGASFIVNGATPPKNSALTSAGAELHITQNWSLTAKFDGEFASGSQTYAGTGTLRYTW